MATSDKLLSTKTQDKAQKIDSNPEDKAPIEVGGPELDWSTADYANMAFDATTGVKVDTTILPKAKVKAEKGDVVKEEAEDDEDEEKLTEELPVVTEMDYEDDEDAGLELEGVKDDAFAIDEADDDDEEKVSADDADDTLELELADLIDHDTELVELDTDKVDDAVVSDDDQDLLTTEADEEDIPVEESTCTCDGSPCTCGASVEEASEDTFPDMFDESADAEDTEDDEEKAPVAEGTMRIRFKVAEAKTLFENNTVLSEEDKRQSRVLFESAIRSAVGSIGKQLQEAYQARFRAAKQLHEKKLAAKVNRYLSYAVEQWVKDNRVSLQHQLRNRLSENFMRGLKTLFVEHYVDVPASKVNVVESLAKNVKSLKSKLSESEAKLVQHHADATKAITRERQALIKEHCARLIAESAAAVVAADRGQFVQRAATVKFTTTQAFKKDLVALREQYFRASKSTGRSIDVPDAAPLYEEKKSPRSVVDVYAAALDKISG